MEGNQLVEFHNIQVSPDNLDNYTRGGLVGRNKKFNSVLEGLCGRKEFHTSLGDAVYLDEVKTKCRGNTPGSPLPLLDAVKNKMDVLCTKL